MSRFKKSSLYGARLERIIPTGRGRSRQRKSERKNPTPPRERGPPIFAFPEQPSSSQHSGTDRLPPAPSAPPLAPKREPRGERTAAGRTVHRRPADGAETAGTAESRFGWPAALGATSENCQCAARCLHKQHLSQVKTRLRRQRGEEKRRRSSRPMGRE